MVAGRTESPTSNRISELITTTSHAKDPQMPKPDKNPKAEKLTGKESAYTMMPWSCNHYPTFSEIEAYLPITGNWEIVADIHDTRGVDAEILTNLITRAVNCYEKNHDMIARMMGALELCLEGSGCLTAEAEYEVQSVLKRAQQMK